ncbi:MAG: glutaredoxin family protein [Candidatus Saccharimonas sp.]|nr:glutaredoxin family protein [Candidatus Saccharimonas sp.]
MEITVYSTSTCSFCHALMSWLDTNKIVYTKVVTDEDEAGMIEFMNVNDGMIGVPFTVIVDTNGNTTKISGYDQPKFKQVLGL